MDLEKIEDLLKLLREHDVNEFELQDGDLAVAVKWGAGEAAVAAAPVLMAQALAAPVETGTMAGVAPGTAVPAAVAAAAAAPVSDEGHIIESPMVGTFYRASQPGVPNFVEVGDRVNVGQTICIVEAMKLMNEIEADADGVVEEVLVEDARPVQFGQALFRIRKG
jgi:acetyl-CoA carboxylase biotin carboxyl carrier protein